MSKQVKSSGTPEKVSEYRDGSGRAAPADKVGGKAAPKVGLPPRLASYRNRSAKATGPNHQAAYRK